MYVVLYVSRRKSIYHQAQPLSLFRDRRLVAGSTICQLRPSMEASYAVPHKARHLVTPFIECIVFNKQQNTTERHKMQASFYKRSSLYWGREDFGVELELCIKYGAAANQTDFS